MGRVRDVESHLESDYESNNGRSQSRTWTHTIVWSVLSYGGILVIFIRACFPNSSLLKLELLPLFIHGSSPALFYAFSQSPRCYLKPKNIEIVALVPFHQHGRTEILNCYLRRNLASNGGFLDRVVFIPQTNDTESLDWLMYTVNEDLSYSFSEAEGLVSATANESMDILFVWIDGDVVFSEAHTIPTMVKTKLDHPDSLIVSANVINEAVLEKLHSHPSIALPYLPEVQPAESVDHSNWRASALPHWEGPAQFQVDRGLSPPFKDHR
ncbi:uncharacterized protein BDV17DRAFT_191853 [Aspergillus undulatus]|uniref:uncharacterized protein n=1 Tax=Aspergillus undulatus TaxID=1810928 RepID=UPI003CCE4E40